MKTLHDLWLEILTAVPDHTALHTAEGGLSNSLLEERSCRLSNRLLRHTGGNALIAIPFSSDYFVALHACMRTKVAACPVDLTLPREMLLAQLGRFSISCVIARKDTPLPSFDPDVEVIALCEEDDVPSPIEAALPGLEVSEVFEDAPLQRLFTSGSSGQQSLVTIGHLSMAHDVLHTPEMLGIRRGDVFCSLGSHVSAMQIFAFWRCVLNGITFVPIDPKAEGMDAACDRLLSVQPGILRGHMTIIRETLEYCRSMGAFLNVSRLILGGESLKSSSLKSFIELLPSLASITHNYSSTEALFISAFTEGVDRFLGMERIPVGYPQPGKDVSIVDNDGRPLPIGEAGEIVVRSEYICSDIQGRDSQMRLELDGSKGFRTYRTGDLGRMRQDGMLEHLGRVDRQIKINGVRIDPLIVEQSIESNARVSSCIVTAVSYNGGTMLVAAYVSRDEVDTESLRKHVNALLPTSHQPQVFLSFDSLPRTERGKPALAELERMVCERLARMESDEGLPLSTSTQFRLASLWSEVLGKEVQYRDADFFRLGGHSLIALRLAARIHRDFGVSVTLSDFFSDGRLETLSAKVDAAIRDKTGGMDGLPTVPLGRTSHDLGTSSHVDAMGGDMIYPASVFQSVIWRFHRLHPASANNHMSLVWRLQGDLDREALSASFRLLSASQPSFRTVFFERGGEVYQRVLAELPAPFEWIGPETAPSEDSPEMTEFLRRPFDLEKGPLLRCRVVCYDRQLHVLQVVTHHIVSDAVSNGQWCRELSGYYNEIRSGGSPLPPARGMTPGDLAMEQVKWLKGSEAEIAARFWMERFDLGGMDHPWPWSNLHEPTAAGAPPGSIELVLDEALSRRIRSYTGRHGTSFFRFMLGTYFLTLQGLLPERAITVDVPISLRRTEEEFEMVGCLINSFPLTMEANDSTTVEDYLGRFGRRMDEAMRHARVPSYLALEEWKRVRGIRRHIVPNTAYNFKENAREQLNLTGAKVEVLPIRRVSQPRDLILTMARNSGLETDKPFHIHAGYDSAKLSRAQAERLLDTWVSIMRHCTEGEDLGIHGASFTNQTVYVFPDGTGGFEEYSRFHRTSELLGERVRLRMMPDPEASFGRLPVKGVGELANVHAGRILQMAAAGKTWLLGEGLGAVDAFAVACELLGMGQREVGLILLDPVPLSPTGSRSLPETKAVDTYERMPDCLCRLREMFFDLRLAAATRGPLRYSYHPLPVSRAQVYRAAVAYGLFDPVVYGRRYGCMAMSGEEMFEEYLREGWKSGRLPSEGFHAHRYREVVEGFVPGSDEPVLHALLFGMGRGDVRRRIVSNSRDPLVLSDVLSARTFLRMEAYAPGMFRGEVHLVKTGETDGSVFHQSWRALVDGEVYMHQVDVATGMGTESVALVVKRCMESGSNDY